MRSTLSIIAMLAAVFAVGCQTSDQNSSAAGDLTANTVKSDSPDSPLAVLVMHVGPERKPIWPLVWYADEVGLRMAIEKIPATYRGFAKKEKVTMRFLKSLRAQVNVKHFPSADRPFGSTELTFVYENSSPQIFLVNGTDFKAACGKLQSELPKASYVWDYFVRIGVSQLK